MCVFDKYLLSPYYVLAIHSASWWGDNTVRVLCPMVSSGLAACSPPCGFQPCKSTPRKDSPQEDNRPQGGGNTHKGRPPADVGLGDTRGVLWKRGYPGYWELLKDTDVTQEMRSRH